MFERIIGKVPGEVSCSKTEKQGYVDNLEKKNLIELTDLLNRQDKLLENRSFISKLPDKGEKIRTFRDKLVAELDQRRQIDQAATLLSRLNIASEGKDAMNELEWTGKYSETSKVIELDSDDDEDPLKILAQPTGSGVHKKKIITVVKNKSLITAEDLKEIESIQKGNLLKTQHIEHLTDIVEKTKNDKRKKEGFKPYKTTLSDVHDPMKEKQRKKGKKWEVTAATPPLIVHGAVKVLSIHESLTLEKERTEKIQEAQKLRAIERLAESIGLQTIGPTPENPGNYRATDHQSDSSDSESEVEEVHDDDDDDKAGTVVFSVDTIHE